MTNADNPDMADQVPSASTTDDSLKESIQDNTVTVLVKSQGKVYAFGATIGDITPDIADEDLDSTLRALAGLGLNMRRTVATTLAGRDENYVLPNANVEDEQDLTPQLYTAVEDIKKGDVVSVNPESGLATIHRDPEPESE